MKAIWLKLGPKYQRLAMVGCVVVIAAIVAFATAPSTPPTIKKSPNSKQKSARYIFTDKTPHETGIEHLSADVKALSKQNAQLQETLSLLQNSLDEKEKKIAVRETEFDTKVKLIEQQLGGLFAKNPASSTTSEEPSQSGQPLWSEHPRQSQGKYLEQPTAEGIKIYTYSAPKSQSKPQEVNKTAKKTTSRLPAGSVLKGILLNGMDAPTSKEARRNPVPILARLQADAILPNLARADVKECFLLLSGYGDISAERAYLRGETLSCVCEDGSNIEAKLDGYATSEDGKVGVRGRVVSKQGRAIANSMMAGFLGGAASAFDVNPVPSIDLSGGNKRVFQSALSPEVFQGAAVKGAGQAMDRVAKFYLDMAENLFPVIEIDAGREIEVVVKKGIDL